MTEPTPGAMRAVNAMLVAFGKMNMDGSTFANWPEVCAEIIDAEMPTRDLVEALRSILGELDFDISEHTHAEKKIRAKAEAALLKSGVGK